MKFNLDSPIMEGAFSLWKNFDGNVLPYEFTGPRDEFMATRTTASLGVFLNVSPIYDISGKDAEKFLNKVCVNRDFNLMKPGGSRHGLICNEKGQLLASGVILKKENGDYRTYWLAPAIQYFLITSGMDVQGEYCDNEYFYQLDGPKSLEILEEATEADLHDLKFGQNKKVQICGTDIIVYRLGMTGALAYELHGAAENAEIAYKKLREVLFKFGGKLQGVRNYISIEHTPAGYPNQFQHFWYPFQTSGEGLAEFANKIGGTSIPFLGSASDDPENYYVSPFDIGWGKLVSFDKDEFIGKDTLEEIAKNPAHTMVTLEWNADDVADVFASQFRGTDIEPYEQIEHISSLSDASQSSGIRADYVLADGKKIGIATGKTYSFYEQRMISLASIQQEYAEEGTEVAVLWGSPGNPQKEIRAKVARFPYFNAEYRNETFDVEKIPRRK